ncbi:MAG TPA: TolC family protein [Sedimentisphaerales bacterium]|nr:TolC family protein [Sedimentisphaerales bacterium]HRS11141.1 TolC family protein [Sedimentisphaerales bacterium]HRV47650.1 TolC family protein [Sedimentisphaerales bacterium]
MPAVLLGVAAAMVGCKSPQQYRHKADKVGSKIISDKQAEALGTTEPFTIERPSDILRRRLLEGQDLPRSSQASLGTDALEPIEHWPDPSYPPKSSSTGPEMAVEPNRPVKLSLLDALQVGAHNSFEYQSRKEEVFRTALSLDLTRNDFRNILRAQADSQLTTDTTGDETVTDLASGASLGLTRSLKNGLDFSSTLVLDLLSILTQGGSSALGLSSDTSVSIPLLRGAGRHIVTEPLTQAERDVVYAIWEFERYKRTFAVNIAQDYFGVLRQMDSVANARDNYRSAITSARYARRRADAGLITQVEVDQAVQRELGARNGWISANEQLAARLDAFKSQLGLPPDASIELDPNDLVQLRSRSNEILETMRKASTGTTSGGVLPADAPVELQPASYEDAGPYEIDEAAAIKLALENRRDLQVANGRVYDAQRVVVVRADALRAGLTLGGQARFADNDDDGSLQFDGGRYAALLSLDLPLERTAERNAYRNSLIDLERATRTVQQLEDQIKLSIRNQLRTLLESRESIKINAQQVVVAEKRVRSAQLYLEAGRAQIRDLLEAQDALLSAQNQLTAAVVNYRIAELELQRDLGLLQVNEKGLWQEFSPGEINHDS